MNSDPRISIDPDPPHRAYPWPRSGVPPRPLGLGSAQGENRSCARRISARRSAPVTVSGWPEPPGRAPSAPQGGGCPAHQAWGSLPVAPVKVRKSSFPDPLSAGLALRPGAIRTRQSSHRRCRGLLWSSSRAGIPPSTIPWRTGPRRVCARQSIGLFRSFHSALCMGRSATITPAIPPMSTSQALADPSRAGLGPTVSNKLHQPLTCSALHLRPPCR